MQDKQRFQDGGAARPVPLFSEWRVAAREEAETGVRISRSPPLIKMAQFRDRTKPNIFEVFGSLQPIWRGLNLHLSADE